MFQNLWRNEFSAKDKAIGELTTGALFFGMRSCEYSTVKGERKTKLLHLKDLQFLSHKRAIPRRQGNLELLQASSISITFYLQKNDDKGQTITMHRNNSELCPVRSWATITLRILEYKGASIDLPVNSFQLRGKFQLISSNEILKQIRATVEALGEENLGIKHTEVGCHSIRSSFAMFLYLQYIRTDKIMLQGRWKSDAFLLYIRVQVANFSSGLSKSMIQDTSNFFTIPDTTHDHTTPHAINNSDTHTINGVNAYDLVTNPDDPRSRNNRSFAHNINNFNGPGSDNPRISRPSFFSIFS